MTESTAPDLAFSGRDSNHNLGFRRWNASSHASYYTPVAICDAIADAVAAINTANTPIVAFDPTCGSGRMLVPFRAAGADVLGIEMDEETIPVAKHNLLSKNVRAGDLLLYRKLLKSHEYGEGANVVVTNPPYGIWWTVPETEGWETVNQHGSVESQAFTLELCSHVLHQTGLLFALIPSSTFDNAKDAALRKQLYQKYNLLAQYTITNAFFAEYGIAVSVDLVVGVRVGYRPSYDESRDPKTATFDATTADFQSSLTGALTYTLRNIGLPTVKPLDLPQAALLVSLNQTTDVQLTEKGVAADLSARAMLDFLNATVQAYSPVQGVRTGVIDAYCSPPALIKRGSEDALTALSNLGFTATISDRAKTKIARQQKRYARLSIPLYRPKPHQLIGYFDDKPYPAIADVSIGVRATETGIALLPGAEPSVLWQKGKLYQIHPTWIRKRETAADETTYNEAKKRDERTITQIDRGYLLLQVQTEAGMLDVAEIDEEAVSLFLTAFALPVVEDVDDLLPDEVERDRARLDTLAPHLFDYQNEDGARLVTKPRAYIAWEVGGGKTPVSIAISQARQYQRTLIVCESRLVEKWLEACQQFGVVGHRLESHRDVAILREQIRTEQKPSGFWVTSYEFLALDGSKRFHPWDCVKFDKEGAVRHQATGITTETCECGTAYETAVRSCPKCEESEQWTGHMCQSCGFVAYTYDGVRRQRPAYKALSKLFSCVIADEAQVAKSKLSLRGQALRSFKSKGRYVLSATLFKGYVTDVFWTLSWILGWNNPLFPYSYKGGAKRFLDCYATYKFVTKQYEETLHAGKALMLPEVSSLNLFARLMAPFMVRRVDGEMATLPTKHPTIIDYCGMRSDQHVLYGAYESWSQDRINRELAMHSGEDVNMGVISQCLWTLRFAASDPTARDHMVRDHPECPNRALPLGTTTAKLDRMMQLVRDIRSKGDKVIVTSPLRPLVAAVAARLKKEGVPFTSVTAGTSMKKRHETVKEFNRDKTPVLLASMGAIARGLDIIGANHIIVLALEWSPEILKQVCGRIHRPGQTKECYEYILLAAGTIDGDMHELCAAKFQALREAIDGTARYSTVAEILERATKAAQLDVARRVAQRPLRVVLPPPAIPSQPEYVPEPDAPDIPLVPITKAQQTLLF